MEVLFGVNDMDGWMKSEPSLSLQATWHLSDYAMQHQRFSTQHEAWMVQLASAVGM